MLVRHTIWAAAVILSTAASYALDIKSLQQTPFLKSAGSDMSNMVRLKISSERNIPIVNVMVLLPAHDAITTATSLFAGDNSIDLILPTVDSPTTITVSVTTASLVASSPQPLSRDFLLQPVKRWKIFAVPSTHLDIGYTANRKVITDLHNDNFDAALRLMTDNPDVTWNAEVAWEVQNYLQERPVTSATALLSAMQSGKFGFHAGYLNMLTALMSDEAMNRYCLYAAQLGRDYDIHTSTAILSDVPTATWALPSVLSASGVKFFAEGCNPDRGPMLPNSNRDNPFYWEGPDGKKVLTLLSRHYALNALWLAESPDYAHFEHGVANTVAPFLRPDYPMDAVYLYGAFLDNRPFNANYGRFLADYKARWDYPEIIISTSDEFFEYVEANSKSRLETVRGDFGAFWEDGAGSTAQATAVHMENQRRVLVAETLFSLAKLARPDHPYPADQLEQVWQDILFYNEHTWGAAESISHPDSAAAIEQWTEKSQFSSRPHQQLDALTSSALAAFAPSSPDALAVINPLGFSRSGYVALPECPPGTSIQLLDSEGKALPTQISGETPHARIPDMPGFGRRHYTITTAAAALAAAPNPTSTTLENQHYRITGEPDVGISSIVDLASGREMLDTDGPYHFGQIVYALGGEDTSMVHSASGNRPIFVQQPRFSPLHWGGGEYPGEAAVHTPPAPPLHQVHVHPAGTTSIRSGSSGPLHSELIISSKAPSMPSIETTVRLHHLEKRISVDVHITGKLEERRKEGVYIAFPFAAASLPEFRLGMTNSISDPAKDFLASGCHEWYCVQDFVKLGAPDSEQVLWTSPDAPLVTLSELNRGTWKQHPELTTATVFSYTMNNYWHTNYKAGQGGDFHFRYNLTSSPNGFSDVEALKFARSTASPVLAVSSDPASNASSVDSRPSLTVTGKGVIASTLRRATNGNPGYIIRIRNPGPTQTEVTINDPGSSSRFKLLNLVENDLDPPSPFIPNPATIQIPPHQTVTTYME